MRSLRSLYPWFLVSSLSACGGNDAAGNTASASLQVRFGDGSTTTVDGAVADEATSARVLLRVAASDVTVLVSLARPLDRTTLILSETSSSSIIVWAKQGVGSPLVGVAGQVSVTRNGDRLDVSLTNVEKPMDTLGTSLWISGVITGIEDHK